jgi:hypothetical protein
MWPTWWWPQAFMQPEMLSVDLADVVLVVEVVEAQRMDRLAATGIDLALASEQKSPPGQQMMSVSRPMLARREAQRLQPPTARAVALLDVGEHQVLLVVTRISPKL